MKKIAEIAKDNGVTVQAVYQKINKFKLNELKDCIKQSDKGQTLVNKRGEELLKASFRKSLHSTVEQDIENDKAKRIEYERVEESVYFTGMVEVLKKQIESLEKRNERLENQIDKKDQIIKEKDQNIKEHFMMIAHISGEMKKLQASNETKIEEEEIVENRIVEEKKPFWSRLFG